VTESGRSKTGLTKWSVVTGAAPSSDQAFNTVVALRHSTKGTGALVAGPTRRRSTSVTQPRTIAGC